MSRRQAFVHAGRILLLRWRVVRGRALPPIGLALMRCLDRLALRLSERAVDQPWTAEGSRRLDAELSRREERR